MTVLAAVCAALAVLTARRPGPAVQRRMRAPGPLEPVTADRPRRVPARRQGERLRADLPAVLDLISACLTGGSSLPDAAVVVAAAVPGPCADRLERVLAALAVGVPPADAWLRLGPGEDDPLAAAARLLAAAADSGAPAAVVAGRLAAESRAAADAARAAAVRRVGVLAVAPLGLCFLPAFVLLGVVPAVVGLLSAVLIGR